MADLWPWLAVAGAGALHGLSPASGWALVACAPRPCAALGPVALGHGAAVLGVAALVAGGGPASAAAMACAVLLALALARRHWRTGVALGSALATALHGSGLMLVPALVPLCLGAAPAREITASGSLPLALAALAVHTGAMVAVTAVVAFASRRAAQRWISILPRHEFLSRLRPRR